MSIEPYYADDKVTLYHGDCLEVLAELPDASIDAVVTDPPYGISFMGKAWDAEFTPSDMPMRRTAALDAVNTGASRQGGRQRASGDYQKRQARDARAYGEWCEQWAAQCLRVLKPGGYLLAFGGTRTYHRIACAVEDAGFELRDSIAWLYGQGFPKSLDLSKALDKAEGHWRGRAGDVESGNGSMSGANYMRTDKGDPVTPAAAAAGWGTTLKPAHEPIVVGRKSTVGTVAANWLEYGTGALNINACRTAVTEADATAMERANTPGSGRFKVSRDETNGHAVGRSTPGEPMDTSRGRWPANVVLDQSQAAELDRQTGNRKGGGVVTGRQSSRTGESGIYGHYDASTFPGYDDEGGASRFFPTFRYEAKAATSERPRGEDGTAHPTVKPLDLMRWLVRLVTPPGGIVLEPFAGSGTTAEACVIEGFGCIAIEREAAYLPLIVARLSKPIQPNMFGASA